MKQFILTLKLLILSGLVLLLIILGNVKVLSLSVEEVPNPRQTYGGWVTDMAEVLTDNTEQQLNRMIAQFKRQTTIEMAVVTVEQTKPFPSPKAFTTELFNTWGIGKAGSDNGLLFLISIGERRVEIETGSGIEKLLPSSQLQVVLTNEITPKLSRGDFNGGTLAGTRALITTLSDKISILPLAEDKSSNIINGFNYALKRILLTTSMAIGFSAICFFIYSRYQNYCQLHDNRKRHKLVSHATLIERGWAVFLDLILLAIIYSVVAFVTAEPYKAPMVLANAYIPTPVAIALMLGNLEGSCTLGFLIGCSSFGAALLIYRIIAEAFLKCTFGQLASGVRVIKADNSKQGVTRKRLKNLEVNEEKPISFYAALVRNLMLSIDGFFIYLVGVLAIIRSDKSQRLGDRLAQTVVVCRHINLRDSPNLNSTYIAGGSFGIRNLDTDFGDGSSDGGGAGSDF